MLKYRINRVTYWAVLVIGVVTIYGLAIAGVRPPGLELLIVLLGVPRLHDIGRSGWHVMIAIGLEFVVLGGALLNNASVDQILIAGGVLAIVILLAMIVLGLIPGDQGPNRWGDVPASGVNLKAPRN